MSNELKHYGVLGMKWGVRRSKERLGRRKIRKGTIMYRTTADVDETTSGHKYVTYLAPDRDLYRGDYSNNILKNANKSYTDPVYENTYKLKKDLLIPSRKEVKEVVDNLIKREDNKKMLLENGKAYVKFFIDDVDVQYFYKMDEYRNNHPSVKDDTMEEYTAMEKAMFKEEAEKYVNRCKNYTLDHLFDDTTRSFGLSEYNRNLVIDELKKRGYNAMVDVAGIGYHNTFKEGVDPLIIFDGDDTLDKVSTSQLDVETRRNASDRYDQWYKKVNKKR